MAYNDWVDTEPVLFMQKPNDDDYEPEAYGFHGNGWYFVDENGMLVGGPHQSKGQAINLGQHVKANRPGHSS